MAEYIAFDSHKRYTLAEREQVVDPTLRRQVRIEHAPGAIRSFLDGVEPGTPVAVEATGNWYWIVDEIERAGAAPRLVHPRKAKLMMGMINKTDELDVHGLNVLQRNGTLPTVWIPPGELRDLRELTRLRMVLSRQRTTMKNRITATLAKYGVAMTEDWSDSFCPAARSSLLASFERLPAEQATWACRTMLAQLQFVQGQIDEQEQRLRQLLPRSEAMRLLDTIPGVGLILAAVIALEVGDVERFSSAERLASYAGTTPRVHASGGKVRHGGRLRPDVNRYLKWAFVEAANSIALNHGRRPERHASQLYRRIKARKGGPKAIGAVARHLAEAAYHVLHRREAYRDPAAAAAAAKGTRRGRGRNNQDASAVLS
jgi:transposase